MYSVLGEPHSENAAQRKICQTCTNRSNSFGQDGIRECLAGIVKISKQLMDAQHVLQDLAPPGAASSC